MYTLLIVIVLLLIVALYPVIRDIFRRRHTALPAYVEGLRLLLDGKIAEAAAKLKIAVEEDTSNVDAYILLGNIFLDQGDTERALRIHESLTLRRNLKPAEELAIYRALVKDYIKTDRKIKAIPLLEELVRADRTNPHNLETLLTLYIETSSWDKCQQILKDAGRVSPTVQSRLYTQFGHAYGKVNPKEGISWLREAIRLNKRSVTARILLGDLLLSEGNAEEAIRVWNELLEILPEKSYLVQERLERAYYELGRYEEITQLYRRLLHRVPNDTRLAVALAEIYAKKEELQEAIKLLQQHIKNGDTLTRLVLAQLLLQTGKTDSIRQLLEDAIARLRLSLRRCWKCGNSLPESEIQCPHCTSWQEDIT